MRVQHKECHRDHLEHNSQVIVFWAVHRKDVGTIVTEIPTRLRDPFLNHPKKVLQHLVSWQVLQEHLLPHNPKIIGQEVHLLNCAELEQPHHHWKEHAQNEKKAAEQKLTRTQRVLHDTVQRFQVQPSCCNITVFHVTRVSARLQDTQLVRTWVRDIAECLAGLLQACQHDRISRVFM